jgi:NitT/TauT family transport system substrate-binding protein
MPNEVKIAPRAGAAAAPLLLFLAAAAAPAAAETIRYNLNWLPQGEHCGFFQAEAAGLYEAAGLDVEILAGGPNVNVNQLVAGGKVDLGMGSSFTALNLANGGIDAVTVAAFFQKSPQTLVAHPGTGVETLADLKDREIMVANFSRQEFWQFLKAEHGFSDSQLAPYAYSAAPFLADEMAVQQGYVTEDAHLLGAEMADPPVSILLADHGFDSYATTVYGMRDWIEDNRDAVQTFLDATAEGYRQCLAGEAEAAKAAILEANPDHSAALFDFKLEQMRARDLVTGDGDLPIGAMDPARWESFVATMVKAGVYPETIAPSSLYDLSFMSQDGAS